MAIDWTKPIRQKNGDNVKFIYELKNRTLKYPILCVVKNENGEECVATYTKDGRYDHNAVSARSIENIPEPKPEVDWDGEVQMRRAHTLDWEDVTIWCHPNDGYVRLKRKNDKSPSTWSLIESEFRNKPAEPKKVQAILKMFRSPKQGIVLKTYIKNDATTVPSVRRWHEDTEGELLDVIEVDLHNAEGLEDNK